MNRCAKIAYEIYYDELRSIEEDFDSGKISKDEYFQYLKNIEHNLEDDLREANG